MKQLVYFILSLMLISACQYHNLTQDIKNLSQATAISDMKFQTQTIFSLENQNKKQQLMKAIFHLNLPFPEKFSTQSLQTSLISFIKIEISGIGIATPLWADGSDGSGLVANVGGDITLTVSNIPYGSIRLATLTAYDSGKVAIPGATIQSIFSVSAPTHNVELSFRSTLMGAIVEDMLNPQSSANDHLTSLMNLSNLSTFVDSVIGIGGTYPNYTFTRHPGLVNSAAIATDLLGNGGDPTLLNPANVAYQISPGTLTGAISGLVSSDKADIQVSDPASLKLLNQINGALNLTGIQSGTWKVLPQVSTGAGTTYSISANSTTTVSTGGSDNIGTITFTPATPVISSLSSSSAKIGATITINGSNFHANANGNTVGFGGTTIPVGDITVVSSSQLNVVVPTGISGTFNITVSVGSQTSNVKSFTVLPDIASVSPGSGFNDDLTEITITGTGFQNAPTVKIGSTSASNIIFNSSTQVKAIVPSAITAGTYHVTLTNPDSNSDVENNSFMVQNKVESWSTVNSGINALSGNVQSLLFDPSDKNKLYCGTSLGGAFKTVDGGSNWSVINVGLLALDVPAIAINPVITTTLYAGSTLGINQSSDSGSNWSTINTGLPALNKNTKALLVNPTTPTTIYAGLNGALGNGVYQSTDSGSNWSSTSLSGDIQAMAIDPSNSANLYAGQSSGLSRSTDNGSNWASINTGLTNTNIQSIAVHPSNSNILLVGTAGGVFISSNQGASWTGINSGLTNTNVRVVAFHSRATTTLYAGTANGLFKSVDNGSNWANISTGLGSTNIYSLAMESSPDTNVTPYLYVGTDSGGVYKSN